MFHVAGTLLGTCLRNHLNFKIGGIYHIPNPDLAVVIESFRWTSAGVHELPHIYTYI